MRKWAFFSEPVPYNGLSAVKIMLYERGNGETSVFLYTEKDAQICAADEWYPSLADALEAWDGSPHAAWIPLGDPSPGCQEDAFDPVRVKGRADGRPEWGTYEIFRGGRWQEYRE